MMTVRARYYDVDLSYTRDGGWTGTDASLVALLNAVGPDPAAPFLPEVVSAELTLIAGIGESGWEIISFDPEVQDPGKVY